MKTKSKQSGITLMEMTVVIAAIALLAVFGLPAARTLFDSLASTGGTKAMVSAALSSARAIAAKEQHYAGIRFQKAFHGDGPLHASQYMVFIIHDPDISATAFRAVPGFEPIKLPDSVGVMDLRAADFPIGLDSDIDEDKEIYDTTTFSIVFSPTGKLVIHPVRVRNKDGYPDINSNTDKSDDDVFNKKAQVDSGVGIFYQDDYFGDSSSPYPDLGIGPESSRNRFVIYDRIKFKQAWDRNAPYEQYLKSIAGSMIYINPYTGTIINN